MKLRILAVLLAVCAAAALFGACGQQQTNDPGTPKQRQPTPVVETPWKAGDPYPVVTITMEDGGVIKAELYPDMAPNTVHNFISIAKSGYFNGKVFHRASADFMIQGGSFDGNGSSAGFPYSIQGEFANAGFAQNTLKHTPGVLSMARMGPWFEGDTLCYDTNDCQFFIMTAENTGLDNDYAAFGKVIDGMDEVNRIANLPNTGWPNYILTGEKPVIASVTVDTFGIDYPEPVTVPSREIPAQ